MKARLNDTQVAMLRWIAEGHSDGEATNPQRLTARAMSIRRLVTIKGRGPRWHAELTDAGRHYLDHGEYPAGHLGPGGKQVGDPVTEAALERDVRTSTGRPKKATKQIPPTPEVDRTVDSPAGKRRRGGRPAGDSLFTAEQPDPYDEKVLVTVKEAAWMLSLPEHAVRQAVSAGDLDRVFIGEGVRNYRVVYGSLLAWVNALPRSSARGSW